MPTLFLEEVQKRPKMKSSIFRKTSAACILAFSLSQSGAAAENASNPLSKGRNTDLRIQHTDGNSGEKTDYFIDGAFMALDNLKIKYELHYNNISANGMSSSDWEKALVKLIYFPTEGLLNETWGYRAAVGLDWIVEFGNDDQGIGTGSDQLGPFVGVAFGNQDTGLSLIPLVQHFFDYNGDTDISQTALRLIALQPFATDYWAKLDLKVPYDWEEDAWSGSAEVQIGYNINEGIAVYGEALLGIGGNRSFDEGFGVGLRFRY
ncbi:hypothetical protein [Ruegeria atlantica]|uniref:Copper resistance protein B n=4 Tax=Ruegeria atlantica TaxID=81569 RepID=A0A0P1EBU8_9RHOB|nr:hypothetical protein [Ruegeria atlantica]CUH41169.1 hypothetical protein RUM4293_00033 [Ruegeria atlantica]CUH47007.1 hypothetical protein RUA4292_01174 [Ruegeria atlantica]